MPHPIHIEYTIPAGAQFGAPRGNGTRIHQGCDYHCPIGTPIFGTGDGGRVIYIGYNGNPITGSGNNVVIQYGNRITTDMHLRERTPLHVGSIVNHDTIVGYVGITGNAVNADPPGSHDHHQMTVNGKLVNPETFYGTEPASLNSTRITEEEELMPKAVVNEEQDSKDFAWIAVVTENGQLHLVDEGNRGWWGTLQNCYTTRPEARIVNQLEYDTFVGANQPEASAVYPVIDYAKIAKAFTDSAAQIAKAVNDDAAARLAS